MEILTKLTGYNRISGNCGRAQRPQSGLVLLATPGGDHHLTKKCLAYNEHPGSDGIVELHLAMGYTLMTVVRK